MKHLIWFGLLSLSVGAVAAPIPKEKELPATEKQREQSQENLKQIVLGMHNFESAMGYFPGDILDAKAKKPLLSWRVRMLPYMDDDGAELYKKFALDEPWDSKTNKPLIEKMPKAFAPVRVKAEPGHTFYRGFTGNGGFFQPTVKRVIEHITDGTSKSIAVIEAGESVVWTKPSSDIPFDPKKPLPELGRDIDGTFHAALLDGSVSRIKRDFPADAMKAAITISGGEVYESESLSPDKK